MLRITLVSQTPEEVVLKVEGRVSKEDVPVLEEEGSRWLRKVGHLVLDLTGVRSIDRSGIGVLQRWGEQGLVLRSGSVYNRALLAAHGLDAHFERGD